MKDGAGIAAEKRPYRMVARAEAAQATSTRVLDAALELFTDHPYEDVSLEAVARLAGVTKQTVLRRFGSKDELFVTAMDHVGEGVTRQRNTAPTGDVAAAVTNLLDHYEGWGDNRLRMLSQENRIPVVAQNVRDGRAYHLSWVERTFAPLLVGREGTARKRRIAALAALTDVYTWKLLRRDLGLSRSATERTLVELIEELEHQNNQMRGN
jgi:AcrR family transcriptional regulator